MPDANKQIAGIIVRRDVKTRVISQNIIAAGIAQAVTILFLREITLTGPSNVVDVAAVVTVKVTGSRAFKLMNATANMRYRSVSL